MYSSTQSTTFPRPSAPPDYGAPVYQAPPAELQRQPQLQQQRDEEIPDEVLKEEQRMHQAQLAVSPIEYEMKPPGLPQ
jgi:hypothetical protein